jgi:ABC-2 type transport system permease protein
VSASTLIAGKDLKRRLRDRSAFIIGVFAPLALAFIFNAVFGNALDTTTLDLYYGLVDQDDSEVSMSFVEVLRTIEAEGVLTVTEVEDVAGADALIDDGEIGAYFLLEPGLGAAVQERSSYTIRIVGDVDAPTTTQIATSIADQFVQGLVAVQASVGSAATLSTTGPTPELVAGWAQEAAARGRGFEFVDASVESRQLDSATYFSAGMAVFFLFFTVQFGVLGILEEEREGTLQRLLAAPIGRGSVILGKALLSFALGLISMTVLIVATHFLIGAEWGAPLGVALLVVAGVLSAVAIMGLVASVARTPEGAGNLGSIIAVILGMLGGTFFPLGRGDDLVAKLSYLTPHAWFLQGLGDLANGADWTAALPAVLAMTVFALVFGVLAWVLLRRRMRG